MITKNPESPVSNIVAVVEDIELQGAESVGPVNDPQVLERYINLSSIVNFGVIVIVSWEVFAVTFQFALFNGGPASMLYGSILVYFGSTFVALSLAELASIDPAVGAQYRWAAALAPAAPRFWGLLQGWMTVFAWVSGCAAGPALIANIITGLVVFNHDGYSPKGWHTTLIMWALILVPFLFNLCFRPLLNVFELVAGIFHFLFFFIAIITLAVLAERSTPQYVFTTLTTGESGWTNPGVAWGLGLLTVTYAVNGFDGALHMSDEVKKVRTRLPRSIIISAVINSVMLLAFVITLLFTLGNIDDINASLATTGVPLISVFFAATKSQHATNFLVAMPIVILFFTIFNVFASVSRLIWTFSKDKGLPFSRHFAYVHPKLKLPLNALILVCVISALLALINIGSSTAFNAIISLQAMALSISYMPPISFLMIRRIRGNAPTPGPFTLGRAGLAINLLAMVYLLYVVIWMPFPQSLPVNGTNMNYAGPILGLVLLGAIIDWFIGGHERFVVPLAPKMD